MNADLLIEMLHDIKQHVRKTKGKPTAAEAIQIAEIGHLIERKSNAEKTLERMSDSVESLLEMPSNRRKRFREKKDSSEFDLASQGEGTEPLPLIQRMLTYRYKHIFRGRKVLTESIVVAALPRRMQEALCGEETFDLDIKNLLCSILPQMLDR